jgi:hypothetical protein
MESFVKEKTPNIGTKMALGSIFFLWAIPLALGFLQEAKGSFFV